MNMLIDFAPALLFFGAYYLYGMYVATAVLIGALFAVVAWYGLRERRLHRAHTVTAIIASVLGGLTLWIHDPAFIMYKPTAVYAVFALALLASHFIGDRVLLARLPQKSIELPDPIWRKVNLAWAGFFAFCAVLNLYVAHAFSEQTWVQFKTFGFTALMFAFLIAHFPFLRRYLPED